MHMDKKATPRHQTIFKSLLIVGAFAGLGFISVTLSGAAGYKVASEAEAGALGGKASKVTGASGASGSASVAFGSSSSGGSLTKPILVTAYGGGASIAITWDPSYNTSTNADIDTYNVFRNGTKIGSTTPNATLAGYELGTQYIDKTAVKGQTYNYQVQAVSGSLTSAMSDMASGSIASTTTAVPTITVDSSVSANLSAADVTWLQNNVVPVLKAWYPIFGDLWATPSYTPPSSIVIKTSSIAQYDQDYPGSDAVTEGNVIHFRPSILTDKIYASQVFVHESTHVMQDNVVSGSSDPTFTPSWFTEGMAYYATYYVFNGSPYLDYLYSIAAGPDEYYTDGYYSAALLMFQIRLNRLTPTYVRDTNVAAHSGQYGPANLKFSNGKNTDEVWADYGNSNGKTGVLKNVATGKCAAATPDDALVAANVAIATCNGGGAQKVTYVKRPSDAFANLVVYSYCMDPAPGSSSGTMSIWTSECRDSSSAAWVKQTDGTLKNTSTGKCLDISGSGTADGTLLTVNTCNGSTRQQWTTP